MSNAFTLTALQQPNNLFQCDIKGTKGTIRIKDLVWVEDRQDLLEIYYWESWAVLQGAYHCCFSIPGKVLLIPDQPR